MKKVIDYRVMLSFDNGKTWEDTSIWRHLYYAEPKADQITAFDNFADAYNAVADDVIMNAHTTTTFFRGRKMIELFTSDRDCRIVMTEKTFKPFLVKECYIESTRKDTIKDLSTMLEASQFCEWLKDNGITMVSAQ